MNPSTHSIEVSINTAAHRDRLLADAETTLLHTALPQGNAGILITRLTLTDYALTLSAQVPFGQTHIRDHWTRPAEVSGVSPQHPDGPGSFNYRIRMDNERDRIDPN